LKQNPSCSEFISINEEAFKSYMSISKDPDVLFNLEFASKRVKSVDITKIITWSGNEACQNSAEIIFNAVLKIEGAIKNET
jgi:hypothetical protein